MSRCRDGVVDREPIETLCEAVAAPLMKPVHSQTRLYARNSLLGIPVSMSPCRSASPLPFVISSMLSLLLLTVKFELTGIEVRLVSLAHCYG